MIRIPLLASRQWVAPTNNNHTSSWIATRSSRRCMYGQLMNRRLVAGQRWRTFTDRYRSQSECTLHNKNSLNHFPRTLIWDVPRHEHAAYTVALVFKRLLPGHMKFHEAGSATCCAQAMTITHHLHTLSSVTTAPPSCAVHCLSL